MADDVETVPAPVPQAAPAAAPVAPPPTPAQLRQQRIAAYFEARGKGDQKEAHRLNTVYNLGFSDANVPDAL